MLNQEMFQKKNLPNVLSFFFPYEKKKAQKVIFHIMAKKFYIFEIMTKVYHFKKLFFYHELKEFFVSDFNAFINHAYNDNPPLNFLELEIPGKVLEHFRLFSYIFNGPVT